MAVTQENSNASLIFETLYRLVGLFTTYFGEFTEDKFKEYAVLTHEILEEAIDYVKQQTCLVALILFLSCHKKKTKTRDFHKRSL